MTMNDQHELIEDGAVAVAGDRIVAVGRREEIERGYEASRTMDATGRVIMPGLVDCYAHAGHGMIKGIFLLVRRFSGEPRS